MKKKHGSKKQEGSKLSPKVASKKLSTKTSKPKATKSKVVTAEIVDDSDLKFRDINAPKSKLESSEILESNSDDIEFSPLEVAAEQAENAYTTPDEDLDIETDTDIGEELEEKIIPKTKSIAIADAQLTRSTDPLVAYLNEIRKYPLLTREQERDVATKYFETKDPESAQLLVRSNLRFVVKIAAEYSKFGAKLIDLIQEGNVGLMHAVREFNPHKGAKLITYAVWWIRGYIQEYLMRQYSMVRIGTTANQRKLFYQLQKEKNSLDALTNEKNLNELSSKLGIPKDEIMTMAQRLSGRDVSLDKPMDDESAPSLGTYQKSTAENPEELLAREEMVQLLREKVGQLEPSLSEREKIILHERLMNEEPLTLQEIGTKYGITREAVRQMEVRLIKKIKEKLALD